MAKTKSKDAEAPALPGMEGTVKVGDTVTYPDGEKRTVVATMTGKRNQVAIRQPDQPPSLLASLMKAISDPRANPEKVHTLLDARKRVMMEQAEVEYMVAYIKMQSLLPRITRDGKLDQGETRTGRRGVSARYATFENINDAVRPILVEHKFGLFLLPDAAPVGQSGIIIRGKLVYVCTTDYGEVVFQQECAIPVPAEVSGGKNAAQGAGSSISYGKRYATIALLNIVSYAPEDRDDDSRAAGQATRQKPPKEIDALTDKQVADLKKAIEECGATEEMFCHRFQIDKIAVLPPNQLGEANTACRAFKAKREAANAQASAQS